MINFNGSKIFQMQDTESRFKHNNNIGKLLNIQKEQVDTVEFSCKNASPDYMLKKLYNIDADFLKNQIKNKKLKKIFNAEYEKLPLSPCIEEFNSLMLISNLDMALTSVKDKKIIGYINKQLNYLLSEQFNDTDIQSYNQELVPVKSLVDAYNELNGNYVTLKEYICESDGELLLEKSPLLGFLKIYPKAGSLIYETIRRLKNPEKYPNIDVMDFIDAQKSRALIKACSNEEMGNYIYEKYYLPTININEQEKFLIKFINKKFGTKIIVSNEKHNLKIILNQILSELYDWASASDGQAILPVCIDLNSCRADYYANNPACASAFMPEKIIAINGARPFNVAISLRHELLHLNDKYAEDIYNIPDDVSELTEKIIPRTRHGYGRNAFLRVNFEKCKFREELLKGGICTDSIKYAYSDRAELIATAAEAQTDRFSDKFKKILLKLGMPDFVFKLKNNINNNIFKGVIAYYAVKHEHPFERRYDKLAKYTDEKLKRFPKD